MVVVASTGVAALAYDCAATAHSTFKIPIKVFKDMTCALKRNSKFSRRLKETKLIVWDEVCMIRKEIIESVEFSIRDVCTSDMMFAGITGVFAGDFRQCLPILNKKATPYQILLSSCRNSSATD